jgi:hypothetical protein
MMAKTEVGIVFKAYDQTSRQLGLIGGGLDRFKRQLIGLGVGYLSARAIISGLEGIGRAAMADETALSNLSASVGSQSRALADYAKQLATISHYSAGTIMEEMAAAKNMGVAVDQLDEVTTAAIGLAKAYRMDLSEAVTMVAKAFEGETGSLKRRGIIIDETMTAQEKANALLRLGYDNVKLETAGLDTATGAWLQMQKSVDTAKEAFGKALLPTVKKTFESITTWLNTNQADVKRWGENVASILAWTAKKFLEAQDKLVGVDARQLIEQNALNRYRIETGDLLGGGQTTQSRGLWAPMETTNLPLLHPEVYERIKRQLTQENQDLTGPRLTGPTVNPLVGKYTLPDLEGNLPLSRNGAAGGEEVQREVNERLNAYRHMYDQMKQKTEESVQGRIQALNEEADHYLKITKDKAVVDQWYKEQWRKVEIDRGKASDDFFSGWDAGVKQMQDELQTLGELGADSAKLVRDAWVSGTWDMIAAGRSAGDVFRSLMLDWAKMAYTNTMNRFATQGMSWLGGLFGGGGTVPAGDINPGMANVAHAGGLMGHDAFPQRSVGAGLFAGAPRLHGGLRAGEFPAILERGEQVVPRGGSPTRFELHVHDYSGRGLDVESGEIRRENDRLVMEVIARDRRRRGALAGGGRL